MVETSHIRCMVEKSGVGARIDAYAAKLPLGLSRERVQEMLSAGKILLNGVSTKPSTRLSLGDALLIEEISRDAPQKYEPQDIPLDIIYDDPYLAVVNKPAGMVVHPAFGHAEGTLVNALLHKYGTLSSIGEAFKPGIVHRLDKETSGLIIICKDDETHLAMAQAFQERRVSKTYLGLCYGSGLLPGTGRIETRIGRSALDRKKYTVVKSGGKDAITEYRIVSRFGDYFALLAFSLLTGRTHQIRVHAASMRHPILGDPVYGKRHVVYRRMPQDLQDLFSSIDRHCLHAWRLQFSHPRTGEDIRLEQPLDGVFSQVVSGLKAAFPDPEGNIRNLDEIPW